MIQEVVGHAARAWPAWFGDEPAPELQPVLMRAAHDHVVVFLFPTGGSRPRLVLKVAADPGSWSLLSKEYRLLLEIGSLVPADLRDSMPEALGLARVNESLVMSLGFLEGRRLPVPRLSGRGSRAPRQLLGRFLERAFVWSGRLAESTGRSDERGEEHLAERVRRFVDLYEAEGPALAEGRAFGRAVARSRIRWRPGCQHGDPSIRNVLVHRGRLRFADWGDASTEGEPWSDVSYAPGAIAHLMQWQSRQELRAASIQALRAAGWVGQVLRSEIERVWRHPLPLSWAVTLNAMERALRSRRFFQEVPLPALPMAEFAAALLADQEVRGELGWLAPDW